MTARSLATMLVGLMGVYFVAEGLPALVPLLLEPLRSASSLRGPEAVALADLATIAIGVLLVVVAYRMSDQGRRHPTEEAR